MKLPNTIVEDLTPVCPYHQHAYVEGKCGECEKLETEDLSAQSGGGI